MLNESALDKRIREDLRDMREAAGFSQEAIADIFGWGRDAVSKMEVGRVKVRLADYLQILHFCRDADPDHPGLPMVERFIARKSTRPKL